MSSNKLSFGGRYTMLFTCDECGFLYIRNSNSQKYCEPCKIKVKRKQVKIRVKNHVKNNRKHYNGLTHQRMINYRQRWKILKEYRRDALKEAYKKHGSLMNQQQTGKGTGSLGMHFTGDFEKEFELIQKEKRRLGL